MKPLSTKIKYKYTHGKCYRFAFALWLEHGKHPRHRLVVLGRHDSRWVHALLEIKRGHYLDVTGLQRGQRATMKKWDQNEIEVFHPAPMWKVLCRHRDWKEDVRKARWHIKRNRERYLLT